MLEVIHNSHNNNNNYSNSNHGDNMIIYSLPETLLNKPQPPTPAAAAAVSNSITQKQDMASDDLFYRLQKENALLPPQVNIHKSVSNFDFFPPLLIFRLFFFMLIGFHCLYFGSNRTTKRFTRKRPQINIHSIQ